MLGRRLVEEVPLDGELGGGGGRRGTAAVRDSTSSSPSQNGFPHLELIASIVFMRMIDIGGNMDPR
ncbi:hypothetical protein EJB05_24962 [Eragrostis curvula]|uniref:Uncharacterized protein n=1 Tax=Eragrostis curvula TaxID=38414 RepID=A0A5J9VB49_9POAL|nr:hypothetical protein EJB05_24962 [Eragrostis curvula]